MRLSEWSKHILTRRKFVMTATLKRMLFSVAFISAMLGFQLRSLEARREPVTDFYALDWSFAPDPGCTQTDVWVEVDRGPVETVVPGNVSWLQDVCPISHCAHCPCVECSKPAPAEYSCGVTLEFTKTASLELGASVAGKFPVWLFTEVEVAIHGSVNYESSYSGTYSRTATSTLEHCKWSTFETKMQVVDGRVVSCVSSVQPRKQQNCGGTSVMDSGATIQYDVRKKFKMALSGAGGVGLLDYGTCPPGPPTP